MNVELLTEEELRDLRKTICRELRRREALREREPVVMGQVGLHLIGKTPLIFRRWNPILYSRFD